MVEARHYLANDEGTPLVHFDGEDFYIAEPWDVRGPHPGELMIRDEFALLNIADKDLIRRDVTYLENVLEDAAEYISNEQLPGWVWYHWQTGGEAVKRALVYGGLVHLPGRGRMRTPNMQADTLEPVLQLDRHRFFESPESRPFSASNLSLVGGTLALSGGGTAEGRVSSLQLIAANNSAGPISQVWAGIREINEGIDDFKPIWDLHDGTTGTDAAKIADANAYGGHTVEVSFAAVGSNARRIRQTVSQAYGSDNKLHAKGRYLVLLRWSGTTAKTFAIQAAIDLNGAADDIRFGERQYVVGAGTNLYKPLPLGIFDIPPMGGKKAWTQDSMALVRLHIYAELVDGVVGDDLRLNTLTFIPADRIVRSSDANILHNVTKGEISCLPTDRFTGLALNVTTETVEDECGVSPGNFYVPRSGGLLVAAMAGSTNQPIAGLFNVSLEINDRWRTYRRGGEASW